MKKIIFNIWFGITICSVPISAFSTPYVTQKVLKVFHESFPEVKNAVWNNVDNYYEVYFSYSEKLSCRLDYTYDGILISTTRYYTAQELSPLVRAKVNERYPGKSIYGITEVCNNKKIFYYIVLQDDKYWYHIKLNKAGGLRLLEVYIKA